MNSKLKVFTDIGELLTLEGATLKGGRRCHEADLGIIEDAVLICAGGRVAWSGPRAALTESLLKSLGDAKSAESISLNGRTVLPAFVEPHTHLVFAGNRAHEFEWRVQGQTYQEISAKGGGIRFTVNETRKASQSELLRLAQDRADNFRAQGVTTLEVKSGYGLDLETEMRCLDVARAIKGPKIVSTYLGAHSRSPDFPDLDSYIESICEHVLPKIAAKKLADRVDIYIEKGFFTTAHAQRYLECAVKLGFAVTAHVEQLSETSGADTVLKYQPQSVDHLVFVNDETIARIAGSETTAVLLPTSDFYLRMQYPRARQMIDQGCRVALSTDFNPGTSPTQDLSLVGVLARLEMKMTLPEVIVAYTLGAAHAVGCAGEAGSLTSGKRCDFVSLASSWRDLFYSVGSHPVAGVFQAGTSVFS